MDKSAIKRLAVSFAIVVTIFVVGHLIPLPGIADADPFVETGQTAGCSYGPMWFWCWTSYPLVSHQDFAGSLLGFVVLAVAGASAWRRATKQKMIRETEV